MFGTNTTSKKPADIWIENEHGHPLNLFEITVKNIDDKRLNDCIENLNAMGMLDLPVQFVCRLPIDVKELDNIEHNTVKMQGAAFDFIDIESFINSLASLLSNNQIQKIINDFSLFMNDVERPVKTKEGWNKIISNEIL